MNRSRCLTIGLLIGLLATLGMSGAALADMSRLATRQETAPADDIWTSGWVTIQPGQTLHFSHDLGGDPALYAVELWLRDTRSPGFGIHHRAYGGMDVAGQRHGAYWHNLTSDTISVTRLPQDVAVGQIRFRIWDPDPPDYDSGWVAFDPCHSVELRHLLGGNLDEYTVGMMFEDTTPDGLGIHQYAIGGMEAAGATEGAYWHGLDDTRVYVHRHCEDTVVDRVRVLINRPDPPDYDSGWVDMAQGEGKTLTHDLGGNPNTYVVRAASQAAGIGINSRAAGGMEDDGSFIGTNWERLTNSSINVVRRADDISSAQVRVRIWVPEVEEPVVWHSWTNGNFVRRLALQDGVLWAATEGGAVRWHPESGSYTKYLAPDGLGCSDVGAVAPEGSDLAWFGTYDGGLVAFDGSAWTSFTTTDGLAHNRVLSIGFQDGLLWVGTQWGLSAFDDGGTLTDRADDAWTTYRRGDGLNDDYLQSVAVDSSGRKWVGTYSGGLNILDDGGTPFDKSDDMWGTFGVSDGLVHDRVTAIVIDPQDRVWAATGNGLSVLDYAGTPFDKADDTWETFDLTDGLTDDDLYDLALDSEQNLWMATYGGGFFHLDLAGTPFDKSDDTWTPFTTSDGLVSMNLYALALDEASGQVWAGSWGGGISRLDYAGTIQDKPDDTWTAFVIDDPLTDNYVSALRSAEDHTWVATLGGGLSATDGESWTAFYEADGLVSTSVNALAGEELLWVGTESGVSVLDPGSTPFDSADDMWESFRTSDGLNTFHVQDLDLDVAGRLWVASDPNWASSGYTDGGFSVLDDSGTPFDKSDDNWMLYHPEDSGGVFNAWSDQIALDGGQQVWAATVPRWDGSEYVGGGLVLLDYATTPFDKTDDTWTTFTTTDGLANDYAYAVMLDDSGNIWVGTSDGLSVLDTAGTPFDKTDDTWTTYLSADGLSGTDVRDIHFDETGRLWLATDDGVSVLDTAGSPHDKSDDIWLTYGVSDGLVGSDVRTAVVDSHGAVWMGTAAGLSRMGGAVSYHLYLPLAARRSAP